MRTRNTRNEVELNLQIKRIHPRCRSAKHVSERISINTILMCVVDERSAEHKGHMLDTHVVECDTWMTCVGPMTATLLKS